MFDNIIGNDSIKEILRKAVMNQTVSNSYLFVGIEGIGKKLIAEEFAKMFLCTEIEKYCNHCKSCIEFNSKNNPDFSYIEPDGNSIKIEQIRLLQKKIQEKPIISDKKVYIINDANLMTTEAQNCLLKTLEEPPEYATIILIGNNENAFLPTIKSRCVILHFKALENDEIQNYLTHKFNLDKLAPNVLDIFQGSIGKAIKLKDKQEEYQNINKMIEVLGSKELPEIVDLAELLYKSKEEILEILEYINVILLKKSKEKYAYANCINIVEETKKRLARNANYDMCIDYMIFSMWEELN